MKKLLLFSFIASFFLYACNNDQNNSGSASGDTVSSQGDNATSSANTDTSSSGAATAGTSTNSNMPFMASMDKMMKDMHGMKMTDDPDHDFAMMMKSHHQGAIDMSNIEIAQGKNAELKQVAQKIIDDSQKDIKDLDAFMSNHQPQGKSDFAKKAMDMMMSGSSQSDMGMHSGDIDGQFAMMMTKHHKDGIAMAKEYLKSAKAQETKKVANSTIKANSEDIKKLSKWHDHSSSDMKMGDSTKADHSQH